MDFAVLDHGDGDWLGVWMDDRMIWVRPLSDFEPGLLHRALLPVSDFAGLNAILTVHLFSRGEPNARVFLVDEILAVREPEDSDGDEIPDDADNCPDIANPDQADADDDGIGDVCEPDSDGDGVIDDVDNCVSTPNPDQQDTDGDGQGNACDLDDDADGADDDADNCPLVPNADQADFDNDGQGDACDADVDGLNDAEDQCLGTAAGEVTDAVGCSIAQLAPCDNPSGWKNHGAYVSAVAKAAEGFLNLGLITQAQKDAIVSQAAGSQCGQTK